MVEYPTLRDANQARQREWETGHQITLAYCGNELAGEAGEACNIIKKLERERIGMRGSRATVEHLAEELGDVVICADLIAMAAGRDLLMNSGWRVGIGGGSEWGAHLAVCVGKLCDSLLLQEQRHLTSICMDVERAARGIASHYGIDLDAAVQAKFNATSKKVGLRSRMAFAGHEWRHRFAARYSERMRSSGYDADDLPEISSQSAFEAWESRDESDLPEAAADAWFEALSDNV